MTKYKFTHKGNDHIGFFNGYCFECSCGAKGREINNKIKWVID